MRTPENSPTGRGEVPGSGGKILVVDDEEMNRTLLRDNLIAGGYDVREAANGEDALDRAKKEPPDVLLLDIIMPGMDGFEVCRRMKKDSTLAQVPVIIITALSDREARLKGIEAGASDFLTKPIDIQETLLRLRNTVSSKRLYDRLQENHAHLKHLETLRDDLTHMVVHDLRSPLTTLMGYLDLLGLSDALQKEEDSREFLLQAQNSAALLQRMIKSVLDVSRLEAGKMPLERQTFRVDSLLNEVFKEFRALAGDRQMTTKISDPPLQIEGDPSLVRRILSNLLDNAFRFTPQNGLIEVGATWEENGLKIHVADNGAGIPPEYRDVVFNKFGQTGNERIATTGLGLTFCKLAVEEHGGTIGIDDRPGGGSIFWFTLPTE